MVGTCSFDTECCNLSDSCDKDDLKTFCASNDILYQNTCYADCILGAGKYLSKELCGILSDT